MDRNLDLAPCEIHVDFDLLPKLYGGWGYICTPEDVK